MADKGLTSCVSFLYLLFFMCGSGNGQASMSHHHMENNMGFAATVGYFTTDDLYVGKVLKMKFFVKDRSSLPPLLPKEEADLIPFSMDKLPQLFQFFSVYQGSEQAKMMERTLHQCEFEPIEGEKKLCATSFESLLEFVSSIFGGEVGFRAIETTHLVKPTGVFQNYTFLHVKEETSPTIVACHIMSYPYQVYYCHSQSTNKVFHILARGDDGDIVDGVAICHMETALWSDDTPAFAVLHIKPGTHPVCHFFGHNNLIWVQNDM